ncbi:MAG: PIN domain-containing protein [Chloroflexota bacterium]
MKLVREEPESAALRQFVAGADLVTCELVLTELPRALRRAASLDPRLSAGGMISRIAELLSAIALLPLDRSLLLAAGALVEPSLRALDAIHIAAAIDALPHDGFVSYDERQSATGRLVGLRTFAPQA